MAQMWSRQLFGALFYCLIAVAGAISPYNQDKRPTSLSSKVQTNSAVLAAEQVSRYRTPSETDQTPSRRKSSKSEAHLLGASVLLYLPCEVQGQKVEAFVDTGAQATVMSERCARRCGLLGRVDRRYAGRAVGVGSARILGRVRGATLRVGPLRLKADVSVLQDPPGGGGGGGGGGMDLLIGLDVLRQYSCEIDLRRDHIRFHDVGSSGYHDISFTKPATEEDEQDDYEAPLGAYARKTASSSAWSSNNYTGRISRSRRFSESGHRHSNGDSNFDSEDDGDMGGGEFTLSGW